MIYGHHMGGAWWAISILVLVTSVAAIMLLVRMRAQDSAQVDPEGGRSPREILDRRLAIGQIDQDEYRSLRAALADTSPSAEEHEHEHASV